MIRAGDALETEAVPPSRIVFRRGIERQHSTQSGRSSCRIGDEMEPNTSTADIRQRSIAYHEAGHAVTGYYFGRSLGPMRIYEDAGELRGEAKVFAGERGEFCILAAGRACAEAFDLHQHPTDYAIDYAKLDELLSKDIPDDAEDDVFEARKQTVLNEIGQLLARPDFRAAVAALAEHLLAAGSIDSGDEVATIISVHMEQGRPDL
jgi:hypothetical protein